MRIMDYITVWEMICKYTMIVDVIWKVGPGANLPFAFSVPTKALDETPIQALH